jgi:hypothetical protein
MQRQVCFVHEPLSPLNILLLVPRLCAKDLQFLHFFKPKKGVLSNHFIPAFPFGALYPSKLLSLSPAKYIKFASIELIEKDKCLQHKKSAN